MGTSAQFSLSYTQQDLFNNNKKKPPKTKNITKNKKYVIAQTYAGPQSQWLTKASFATLCHHVLDPNMKYFTAVPAWSVSSVELRLWIRLHRVFPLPCFQNYPGLGPDHFRDPPTPPQHETTKQHVCIQGRHGNILQWDLEQAGLN